MTSLIITLVQGKSNIVEEKNSYWMRILINSRGERGMNL